MSPRLIAYAVGAAVLAAVLWWAQARIRVSYQAELERDAAVSNLDSYRKSVEAQARVTAAQQTQDQARDAATSARLTELQGDNEALRGVLARMARTVEKPDANGVARLAINPDWWLCQSAGLTLDAADGAACKARASDGAMPHAVDR